MEFDLPFCLRKLISSVSPNCALNYFHEWITLTWIQQVVLKSLTSERYDWREFYLLNVSHQSRVQTNPMQLKALKQRKSFFFPQDIQRRVEPTLLGLPSVSWRIRSSFTHDWAFNRVKICRYLAIIVAGVSWAFKIEKFTYMSSCSCLTSLDCRGKQLDMVLS